MVTKTSWTSQAHEGESKDCWRAAKKAMAGVLGYTTIRLLNSNRARTPKENRSVAEPHFTKQINIQRSKYANTLKLIAQCKGMFP